MKEIELIFLWCNIDDINGRNLKLLFLFHSFTSNNLCLSRLRSPLMLMQSMCVCVCAWSITFEWMNQSGLHARGTEELASISFVSIWGYYWWCVTLVDITSQVQCRVLYSPSLSLPFWRESCCYIVSCSWPGLLGLFSRSDDSVPVCT